MMNPEEVVVAYINEELEVPAYLKSLVSKYREYAMMRGECVSFPQHEDARMDRVYDALVVLAEEVI